MSNLPSQPILGLIDGMEVLQLLASVGKEMSGIEISRTLKIEKTKVNRILKTLTHQGFAKRSINRKYELGPAIHVLSAQILHGSNLIKNALKYLIQLTELDVIVAMGVLWKDKVAYIYHWNPDIGILPIDGLGRVDLFPATQSSIGIKLLSEKSNSEIAKIIDLEKPIPGFDSKLAFMAAIEETRLKGYGQAIFEGRQSIAIKIGEPTKAAVALANIDESKSLDKCLKCLKEKVMSIEDAVINNTYGYLDN